MLNNEYIKILRANENWESFFKEQQKLSDIRFNYSDKMGAENFTVKVCNALENYDVEDVLYGAYRHNSIDIDQINGLIDLLTPENMITLVIRANTNDKRENLKEKYYGTEYHQIENPVITNISHLPLSLPPKNIYLPEDLKLKNYVNSEKPIEIISKNHSYDCPCILELPIQGGKSEFLKWIESETKNNSFSFGYYHN